VNVLLGALVLLLLGLLGARFSFTWAHKPLGARTFLMAGTHFLLVGLVLGSDTVGLLSADVLQPLYPLLAMIIGWIGLLYGLQLDFRHLRDLPPAVFGLAFLQAVLTFAVFAALATALLRTGGPLAASTTGAVLCAAAVACMSSPLGIAVVANLARLRGRLSELLLLVASLDALVGILAIQLVYSYYHPAELERRLTLPGPEWFGLAVAIGLAFGIIFIWLGRTRPESGELSLFLMGTAALVSGAAFYLGVSALFVAVTTGIVIANASPLQPRVYRALRQWEKPLYVVLLVIAGATVEPGHWLILPLGLGYLVIRLVSKLAGGWTASRFLPRGQRPPGGFGLALAAQSGMPIALLLSISMSYGAFGEIPSPTIELMFGSVVLAIIANELAGPFLTRSVLQRAGEGVAGLGKPHA
jgi:hypothetical protein